MAHIVVIGGSNRKGAQSNRIAGVAARKLEAHPGVSVDLLTLRDVALPLWDESKWDADKPADGPWATLWPAVSARLARADGFVVVTPEWHGMASPHLKNLFCLCEGRELAFKPAYLIAVSSGTGGAYPVAEMRMNAGKNTYIHWLPDHLIVRHAAEFAPGEPEHKAPAWLEARLDHGLRVLSAYAEAARPIRESVVDFAVIKTGM